MEISHIINHHSHRDSFKAFAESYGPASLNEIVYNYLVNRTDDERPSLEDIHLIGYSALDDMAYDKEKEQFIENDDHYAIKPCKAMVPIFNELNSNIPYVVIDDSKTVTEAFIDIETGFYPPLCNTGSIIFTYTIHPIKIEKDGVEIIVVYFREGEKAYITKASKELLRAFNEIYSYDGVDLTTMLMYVERCNFHGRWGDYEEVLVPHFVGEGNEVWLNPWTRLPSVTNAYSWYLNGTRFQKEILKDFFIAESHTADLSLTIFKGSGIDLNTRLDTPPGAFPTESDDVKPPQGIITEMIENFNNFRIEQTQKITNAINMIHELTKKIDAQDLPKARFQSLQGLEGPSCELNYDIGETFNQHMGTFSFFAKHHIFQHDYTHDNLKMSVNAIDKAIQKKRLRQQVLDHTRLDGTMSFKEKYLYSPFLALKQGAKKSISSFFDGIMKVTRSIKSFFKQTGKYVLTMFN